MRSYQINKNEVPTINMVSMLQVMEQILISIVQTIYSNIFLVTLDLIMIMTQTFLEASLTEKVKKVKALVDSGDLEDFLVLMMMTFSQRDSVMVLEVLAPVHFLVLHLVVDQEEYQNLLVQ